ncbi:rod-determining factor RdfA [Natrinema salsiterrestre]|uniref:Uncharacterized protein n=1 Tax=Natrinema salsiterrestre TaxID=2950540 RepID=A0A9Q4L2L7_9EURY|nr:rod-determining factor RdfA [Natrinema salsiterrestre]MDF9746224.1 hypothetical protein [Natrinema salsiterrestre]
MTESMDHRCSCKVGRKRRKYDLDGLNGELRERRFDHGASLRDLAEYVNRRMLETAIERAGLDFTDVAYGAVSPDDALAVVYETLTGDGVPADREVRVRTRLEQRGVDIEVIESDWVTHPTIRAHLNECLEIETSRSSRITPDDSRDTIEWARTRCARVVDQTVSRLISSGHVTVSDPDISVLIRITCSDCGQTYRLSELLTEGSCSCHSDT